MRYKSTGAPVWSSRRSGRIGNVHCRRGYFQRDFQNRTRFDSMVVSQVNFSKIVNSHASGKSFKSVMRPHDKF